MPDLNLKPSHKIVTNFYKAVAESGQLSLLHEGAVAPHFAALLRACAAPHGWTLQEQYQLARKGQSQLRLDGVLVDTFGLRHGVWEAKDTDDDLPKEARAKFKKGYPTDNILFQSPTRAILYQDGKEAADEDLTDPERLVSILKEFFAYEPPHYEQWDRAVAEFSVKVPELALNLKSLIEKELKENKRFAAAFDDFAEVARQAVNPNISVAAVEEMLIQHLLTERIFRKVFNNPDFAQRNVIAHEIEKVITALTSRSFSREAFLGRLDRFYGAIETTAATIDNYREKQTFLNTVYEQFFQGFSVKVADTHGIVYTPQAVVDFMVRSVDDILRREFGRADGLAADGVAILDPFVGTGNFILRVMRQMPRTRLEQKYRAELFCNEVMLLPYYIASMNIEHEYVELTGQYEPFEGIALVDTFELAEKDNPQQQFRLFVPENTERVERQRQAPIFVIIGNPPYNSGQVNANDNNKNRVYKMLGRAVSDTYAYDSHATDKSDLSDPYVKAFRWASDRIGEEGVIAYVSNSSFLEAIAFDGMRKHLLQDFDSIYVMDLGGNVRKNPKISGTTHNVFGIQVGVCITILIRRKEHQGGGKLFYARTEEFWRRGEKYEFLDVKGNYRNIEWSELFPDENYNWLTEGMDESFGSFIPIGTMASKTNELAESESVFWLYSLGANTNRDAWAYNFDSSALSQNILHFIETFNWDVEKWHNRLNRNAKPDDFITNDETKIKWSSRLTEALLRHEKAEFAEDKVRFALYRPFCKQSLFFDKVLTHRRGRIPLIFPHQKSENLVICLRTLGNTKPFHCLVTDSIPDLHLTGDSQCFPFYTYNEDGSNRRENITDWALARFQEVYSGQWSVVSGQTDHYPPATDHSAIDKWAIFHYVYALLHHPAYRQTYAANLRRELPRIPFVRDFWAYVRAGARLAALHVNYEQQPEYPLTRIENPDQPLDWRVEKMRLSKDRTQIVYNDFLTLGGIPAAAFDYRLGNRSALEWVIDQYRVTTDKRSGITNDPNRADDPQYVVRLIGQVVAVSVETVGIVNGLPAWEIMTNSG
ncbi:DNA or RNA helicase of superfamily II [Candidatus Promineifilum breve]|uniref:site-specific DNA-methyltransferase (adenine-specific) n=1 Tax=Candidatus Promineifilum breve TaxID=1806508 RepID=A0A160T5S8_9CHLR|nr:type ISP restriction/modification enzyme [Candidatus Promineifilum breve]CUS05636.1 DNA or RNA helicase of superfamily II [Candidatus Promineifilum breve]